MLPSLLRAGEWFLRSGIQDPNGGVARYYRADLERNHAVSHEITGYTLSTLLYLHRTTGDPRYLERAELTGKFLAAEAWDAASCVMPFEPSLPGRAYFFDTGIIVRGLLSLWRATGSQEIFAVAAMAGDGMSRDFAAGAVHHPVLVLPEKHPLPYEPRRWSLSPGCYQLKSALAWRELSQATGDEAFLKLYQDAAATAMRQADEFLPGHDEPRKIIDRLHAYLYFLEGMLPCGPAGFVANGIVTVAQILREHRAALERSDVYAQLLRVRIYAGAAGMSALDHSAATEEAERLAGFQAASEDPRVDGGFYFGRIGQEFLPYVNPVSTAFALQALAMWNGGSPLKEGIEALI